MASTTSDREPSPSVKKLIDKMKEMNVSIGGITLGYLAEKDPLKYSDYIAEELYQSLDSLDRRLRGELSEEDLLAENADKALENFKNKYSHLNEDLSTDKSKKEETK